MSRFALRSPDPTLGFPSGFEARPYLANVWCRGAIYAVDMTAIGANPSRPASAGTGVAKQDEWNADPD